MTVIVNPGSGQVPDRGEGWTNTYEKALAEAHEWLERIRADGIHDVELVESEPEEHKGRWRFEFRHTVTGVTVSLETHGIDNMDAYMGRRPDSASTTTWRRSRSTPAFPPRVYWNGSSTSEPRLEDWAAPGFTAVRTFRELQPPCGLVGELATDNEGDMP